MMDHARKVVVRYPGGKQRQLLSFLHILPRQGAITGRYSEPFVGGGATFFALNPTRAILSDTNDELIDLYHGIAQHPAEVWAIFCSYPDTKETYYTVRAQKPATMDLAARAARTLYLSRTCFKGMWRHNLNGEFNVGYGGQERRWVINKENLFDVAEMLRAADLRCCDFEEIIDISGEDDFLFIDPPYRPGEREILHEHYRFGKFTLAEQTRLAAALHRATVRGARWAMTNSAHPDILALYTDCRVLPLPKGTGRQIGRIEHQSLEAIILNYQGERS
jgi:DNA adenine methylase